LKSANGVVPSLSRMKSRRQVPDQARSVAQLNWKLLPLIVSPESPTGRSPAIGSVDAFGQRIWREKDRLL
jgi:hypothetical protein